MSALFLETTNEKHLIELFEENFRCIFKKIDLRIIN